MPNRTDTPLGYIEVKAKVIDTVARHAINQCYGVVGMATKGPLDGLTNRLVRRTPVGIDINVDEQGIAIDAYVIVEYGTRIRAVAESIQNTVKFHVEQKLEQPVYKVDVYVQGLRRD